MSAAERRTYLDDEGLPVVAVSADVPELYTEEELATILRLDSPSHVKRQGKNWPHVLIARQRMFRPQDIAQIVDRHIHSGDEVPQSASPAQVAPAVGGRATRGSTSRP